MILKKLEVFLFTLINSEFSVRKIDKTAKKTNSCKCLQEFVTNIGISFKSPFHSNFTKHPLLQTQPLLTRLNDDTLLKPHLEF